MVLFKKIYYQLFIFWLSLLYSFQVVLGSEVYYKGKKYIVANGVQPNSWRLHDYKDFDNSWVPRKDCRLVKNPINLYKNFKSMRNFYLLNWHGIWVNEGIKDWCRRCNIWPRLFSR